MIRLKPENPSEKELVPGAVPLRWDPPPIIVPKKSIKKIRGRPKKTRGRPKKSETQTFKQNFDIVRKPPATISDINQPSIFQSFSTPKAIPALDRGEEYVLLGMGIGYSAVYHINQSHTVAQAHTASPKPKEYNTVQPLVGIPQFKHWNTIAQPTSEIVTLPCVEEDFENDGADMDPLAVDTNQEHFDPSHMIYNSSDTLESEIEIKTESWLEPFNTCNNFEDY